MHSSTQFLNLSSISSADQLCFHRSNGRAITPELVSAVYAIFIDLQNQSISEQVHKENELDYYKTRFCAEVGKLPKASHEDAHCVFNSLLNAAQSYDGGFLEHAGHPSQDEFEDLPGGHVWVPQGMSSITEVLVSDLAGCILYDSKVCTIRWNQDKVKVICTDGQTYAADHVIVTTSLGYIKLHHKSFFQPPLPPSKAKAFDLVPMGKVNKIILSWKTPFWKPGHGTIRFSWTNEEYESHPVEEWYKRIVSFEEMPFSDRALLAFISGQEAEYMEHLSDEEVQATCIKLIRQFLGDPSIPPPDAFLMSRWCTDPYAQGSYSYFSKDMTPDVYDELAAPLCFQHLPRVLFAGEATVNWAYSTVHGARTSGLREAERLIALYKSSSGTQSAKLWPCLPQVTADSAQLISDGCYPAAD